MLKATHKTTHKTTPKTAPKPTRATRSSNAALTEPPVTPGEPVQTGANLAAAQPTTEAQEREINGQDKAGNKLKAMPKDFGGEAVIEGHRVVLRQDGHEVAFRNTDDKKAYQTALDEARGQLWEAHRTGAEFQP